MNEQIAAGNLISHFAPNDEMFLSDEGIKTQQDFLQDLSRVVTALQQRLNSPNLFLVNACENRYYFALVFSAGLVCGMTNLLPQNRQPETLRLLAKKYGRVIVVSDTPEDAPIDACSVTEWLTASRGDVSLPLIADHHLAAIAFTSGSTGDPKPHEKTWKTLCGTAACMSQRLLSGMEKPVLVATVPSQHVYGMEMTAMMALQGNGVVYTGKPFYPEDIASVIAGIENDVVLVTTPPHLRVIVQSGVTMPKAAKIISATAPLSQRLACAAEEKFHASLVEVYGCTESGAIATRRPALEHDWHTLEGIHIEQTEKNFQVRAAHLESAIELQDILQFNAQGSFQLVGRSDDMINIGGKRTSLVHLNHLLLAIDGVSDGVVYMPEPDPVSVQDTVRPAALVVTQLSEKDILRVLSQSLDAVFLPRPLIKVKRIPRNATGKISREELLGLEKAAHA